jgi:ABC-type multidrug transport system ATPase subunit
LIFFARLKGLPRNQVRKAAHDVAKAVGLGGPQVYERNAGLLSGGMRRRLSIAISVLGAPRVLLLDEPTTGLDPSTRYEIWGLLGAFATDERAVIITTHMMIEADTLCDRIAIIAEGNLKVVATQQHLKNKYGSGYTLQLNLVRSSQAHQDMAMEFVRKHINEDAKLDHKQAKTLHISLPRTQSIGKVFKAMFSPERTVEGGINQFLLQQSSLEDVFITLG